MSTAPAAGKICTICGQDCSSKPRTKDPQGRYTCKACLDAAQGKKAAKPAPRAADPEPDSDAAMMAALLASSPAPDITEACPACGSALAAGAVLCTICGYNKQTGKSGKTGSSSAPGVGSAALGAAASLGGAAASKMTFLLLGAVGGIVGGAIGAAVWAGIAYAAHVEIGWIAWGIGFMVGLGVAMLSGRNASPATGLMAAVIAAGSVLGGKYLAVSMTVDKESQKITSTMQLRDEDCIRIMAKGLAGEAEESGKHLRWPAGKSVENAKVAADFPAEIWTDAQERWDRMTPEARTEYRDSMKAYLKAAIKNKAEEIKSQGFVQDLSLFDLLWLFLAVGTAFRIASSPPQPGSGRGA